jgi:hypothetical protein
VRDGNPLELIALPADGSESHFDGTPLAAGVHLRWSFWPELGWPTGGFQVKRRYWSRDEFDQLYAETTWETVATIAHPPAADGIAAAMRSARTPTSGVATSVLEQEAASLVKLVQQSRLSPPQPLRATRGTQVIEVPSMEAVMLASTDPYAARAMGLAVLDARIAPRTPVDYQVSGMWGATPFPWHETRFASLRQSEVARGIFDGDRARLFAERAASLVKGSKGLMLQLAGSSELGLRIQFLQPVLELELELEVPSATTAAKWRISGSSRNAIVQVGTGGLAVTASGTTLRIVAPASLPLDEIEIHDNATKAMAWQLIALRHRRNIGNIGTQSSRIVRVSPMPGTTVVGDSVSIAWPPPLVQTPTITETRSESLASALGEDGTVKPDAWQVETFVNRPSAPTTTLADLARPVRLHTGYVRSAGGGSPARSELSTVSPPFPSQGLSLIGFWRLEGSTAAVAGPSLTAHGGVRWTDDRPTPVTWRRLDMQRRTLYLTGRSDSLDLGGSPGYLAASGIAGLDAIGSELHVQLWVMPIEDAETVPTLVGHNQAASFRVALVKSGTQYRVRLYLNDSAFDSNGYIQPRTWSHVAVHYDGQEIRFFLDGVLDTTRTAVLGPVRPNPDRKLYIGCDPIGGSKPQPFAHPFAGYIADVQIRCALEVGFASQHLLAGWKLDGDLSDRKSGVKAVALGVPRYATDHPESPTRKAAHFDGTWFALAEGNRLGNPGRRLCLKLRIKPDAGQTTPVLVAAHGWKLGLYATAGGYRVTMTVGPSTVASSQLVPAGKWADILVGVDGQHATFFVNGRAGGRVEMPFGRIVGDSNGRVAIGADPASHAGAPIAAYRGLLADLDAGDTIPAPPSPLLLHDAPESPAVRVGEITTRDLEPGLYRTFVAGVDLFGRTGGVATSASFTLAQPSSPPRPGGARARFLPVLGEITSVAAPSSATPRWRIQAKLDRPSSIDAATAARLARHDVELAHVVPADDKRRIESAQTWEIAVATPTTDGMSVELVSPPLPRLLPAVGQRMTIEHDLWVRTEWSWTGTQRLLAPDVAHFNLSERRWDQSSGTWPTTWSSLATATVVPTDVVVHDAPAAVLVCAKVTHADWQTLRDAGVVSLPEPFDEAAPSPAPRTRRPHARIWKVVIPVTTALPAAAGRIDPANSKPDDFVAGALVAYNARADVQAWQLFAVHWHQFSAATGWTVYFVENSRGSETPSDVAPAFPHIRFYPGQRYRVDAMLSPPPSLPANVATQAIEIAVASIDTGGHASPIDSDAQRRSGGAANVIAVNRRRPELPPRPDVSISRADYYGASRATVTWGAQPDVSYQLYRATDNAVIARDIELRRAGHGIYNRPAAERVSDDPDFAAWLAARWPDWVTDWPTRLFVERPDDDDDTALMAAWQAANAVWRDWGLRFYGALRADSTDPSDANTLASIAGRPGNEAAFALVNSKPIAGGAFVDTVPGAVRNRYLYRLRAQTPSLIQSMQYGPVSVPCSPPAVRAATTPAFKRIEAGERRLTLRWTPITDSTLAGYRIYRARSREALDDLRWWQPAADERIVTIADPLLRAVGRALAIPPELDVTSVIGVFRADEYGARAFDYVSRDASSASELVMTDGRVTAVRNLRALPDGVPVTLVYRGPDGEQRVHGALADGAAYVDTDLLAGDDHFYRLVAFDAAGNVSAGSAILHGRAFDTAPPSPPSLDATFDPTVAQVHLSWAGDPTASHMIQRVAPGDLSWKDRSGWLPAGQSDYRDDGINPGSYIYRLRVKSRTGVLGNESSEHRIIIPGGS